MKRVRIGVIGCGVVAQWAHLPALLSEDIRVSQAAAVEKFSPYQAKEDDYNKVEVQVLAVCDTNEDNLKKVSHRYNISRCYTDYNALLKDKDIDAVVVSAGHKMNFEIIPKAVENGKHIMVEKPMSGTAKEAEKIQKIIKSADIKFQVAFMKRFYYTNRKAKQLIEQGVIGEVEAIEARFWSGDIDDLLNNGIHIFDLIQYFGGPVTRVYARKKNRSISICVDFENGAVGCLMLSSTAVWNSLHERVEIFGSNRKTLLSENGRRLWLFSPDEPAKSWDPPQIFHWITSLNIAGYAEEFKHFVECIIYDKEPLAGVESGVYSVKLKEGVEKSLKAGRVIDIS